MTANLGWGFEVPVRYPYIVVSLEISHLVPPCDGKFSIQPKTEHFRTLTLLTPSYEAVWTRIVSPRTSIILVQTLHLCGGHRLSVRIRGK